MQNFTDENGVFILSERDSKPFIQKCLIALQRILDYNCVTLYIYDENFGGFRVYFNKNSDVDVLLTKEYLIVENIKVYLYPLKTILIVQNVIPEEGRNVRKDLTVLMEAKFGKVLKMIFLQKFQGGKHQEWKAILWIPEVEELEIFKRKGSEMILEFPYMEKELVATFFCRNCKKKGHTRLKCDFSQSQPNAASSSGNPTQMDAIPSCSSSVSEMERPGPSSAFDYPAPSSKTFTKTKMMPLSSSISEIKKKKHPMPPGPSNTITAAPKTSTKTKIVSSGSSRTQKKKSVSEPISLSRNLPHMKNATPSLRTSKRMFSNKTALKHSRGQPIPSFFLQCINNTATVLTPKSMKIFLTRVHHKQRLVDFALRYTTDIRGLTKQLKEILNCYYKADRLDTEELLKYSKWLEKLIARFEYDTQKRKTR